MTGHEHSPGYLDCRDHSERIEKIAINRLSPAHKRKLFPMSPATIPSRALYHRLPRLAFRIAMAVLVLIALLYCGLRVYTAYITSRAVSLLEETARIQIGATEESILPLVARYGGRRWTPPPPEDTEDCPNKADCEYFNAHIADYTYGVGISPFNVMSAPERQTGRLHRALAALMIQTPSSWRDPFSLRDWEVFADIHIRAGRVQKVSSGLYVEGRTRWLGNTWELSEDMRHLDMRPKAYAISGTFLTFPGNGGAGTVHYLTPAATPEQFQAARSFNARCLTGLVPCRCLSDLSPSAFQYLSQHPEVGSTITTDDCPVPDNH
jgi:hypothetical protein